MTGSQREDSLERFRNDAETNVLLISLGCGSLGLNLTCANHVFLMDVWWNPSVGTFLSRPKCLIFKEDQAVDRVYRIGQKKQVHIHRIYITDSIEARILKIQERKRQTVDSVFSTSLENKSTRYTMDEIQFVLGMGA